MLEIAKTARLRLFLETELAPIPEDRRVEDGPTEALVYVVRELKDEEAAPDGGAVFLCRPMDFPLFLRAPMGQTATGEGAIAWREFVVEAARACLVGWENVRVEGTEEAAPFDVEAMVDGRVSPDLTGALVFHLLRKWTDARRAHAGKARSASSPGTRPPSGRSTRGRGIASPAPRPERRRT